MRKIAFALFAVILGCAHAFAEQAPSGIKRTPLQAVDFPEGYKTVTGLAEILRAARRVRIRIRASRPAMCLKAKC